jgi:oligoribonuclease
MKLLWVDIETTGLDPKKSHILEVAMIVTEDFSIIDEFSVVISYPNLEEIIRLCNPKVFDMHKANNLWKEVANSDISLEDARVQILGFIEKHFPNYEQGYNNMPIIAGSNPTFDRDFIIYYFYGFNNIFHYRVFDMNTLYMFFGNKKDNTPRNHRAMSDLYADIIAANNFLEKIK